MATLQQIEQFTAQHHIAIAGISRTPHKFGNNVAKELIKQGYTIYPISLHLTEFEGKTCYKSIDDLPDKVTSIFISTKAVQTKELLAEVKKKGIQHIWLQQGSADAELLLSVKDAKENIISGLCLLMFTKPAHFMHRTHAFFKKTFGSYPKYA
ncbi:MAG: CoA-binding protein [Bacteroidales bacterium]|nr:CoA-binding protein [Bacteroidales bacterium]